MGGLWAGPSPGQRGGAPAGPEGKNPWLVRGWLGLGLSVVVAMAGSAERPSMGD